MTTGVGFTTTGFVLVLGKFVGIMVSVCGFVKSAPASTATIAIINIISEIVTTFFSTILLTVMITNMLTTNYGPAKEPCQASTAGIPPYEFSLP